MTTTRTPRAVLSLQHLTLDLSGPDSQVGLVQDVSFDVHSDRTVALIGESGCGKTILAMSILGLLPPPVAVARGRIELDGSDLVAMSPRELRSVRGARIGMVFQDPMSSLNPTMRIGRQLIEARQMHFDESQKESRTRAIELLEQVGIPTAERRLESYPFELSGGMQQRVMIAMAIACDPAVLIADEPTTALDVTIQAEILELLSDLQRDRGMGILLVTHDLGVVADYADDVVVMYAGHVVETSSVADCFSNPQHPYTAALLDAMPQRAAARTMLRAIPGRVPPAGQFVTGCRFRTRCAHAEAECATQPILTEVSIGHSTQCLRVQRDEITVRPSTREMSHD